MRVGGSGRQPMARITSHDWAQLGKAGRRHVCAKNIVNLILERFDPRTLLYYVYRKHNVFMPQWLFYFKDIKKCNISQQKHKTPMRKATFSLRMGLGPRS